MPDYETEQDGIRIAEAFKELPVLTGGSGLLPYVLENDALLHPEKSDTETRGRFAMWKLFGCYRRQIAYFQKASWLLLSCKCKPCDE